LVLQLRTSKGAARDIGGSVRRGLLYNGVARVVLQLLAMASMVVLARLLSAEDYGLYALVTAISAFAALFIDMGFAASVVQTRTLDEKFLATAFWANLAMAVGTAVLTAALAWPLSQWFHSPELFGLTIVSAFTMLLSCNAVNVALLRRAMRFDIETSIAVAAAAASLVVTLGAAFLGAGAYSLVLGPVAERATNLLLSVWRVRWFPRHGPDRVSFDRMWSFGRGLTGFTFVNYWARNLDRFVIGRVLDVATLGYYNRAYNLMNLPASQISDVLSRIFFPAFSAMGNDLPRLRGAWLRVLRAAAMFGVPVGLAIVVSASTLVEALFGPGWEPVIPILQWFAGTIPFMVIGININPMYQALGQTGRQFRYGLVTAGLTIGFMLVGFFLGGVIGIAVATLIRAPLTLAINSRPLLRALGIRWRDAVVPFWRPLVVGAATMAAIAAVGVLAGGSGPWLRLGLMAAVGTLTWLTGVLLLERRLLEELLGRKVPLRPAALRRRQAPDGTPAAALAGAGPDAEPAWDGDTPKEGVRQA